MNKAIATHTHIFVTTFLDYTKRWLQFVSERFSPSSYSILIVTFTLSHVFISGASFIGPYFLTFLKKVICGIFLCFLFFLKLRLCDEIKDYEIDLHTNPDRPLPRGLFSITHVFRAAVLITFSELIFIGLWAPQAFYIYLFTTLYSYLMFKEFFIKDSIRPHLTTYTLLHTLISLPFSLSLLCALNHLPYSEIPFEQKMYALLSWPLFNIYEFGRKSFLKSEERINVETYTSLFGKLGISILIILQVFFAIFCLYQIPQLIKPYFINYLSFTLLLYLLIIITFITSKAKLVGVVFRFFSSFFIILIYWGIILAYLN